MTEHPYGDLALAYYDAGWTGVFPLPARCKADPPTGRTGWNGRDAAREWIGTEVTRSPESNIGIHAPPGILGIDVDAYDDKPGALTLAQLEAECGKLPDTVCSTSRSDGVSGIRWFRVPDVPGSFRPIDGLPGIEMVHIGHRYFVAPGSIHPLGKMYEFLNRSSIPTLDEVAWLPQRWTDRLTKTEKAPRAARNGFVGDVNPSLWWTAGAPCQAVQLAVGVARLEMTRRRHDAGRDAQFRVLRLGEQGHAGVADGLSQLEEKYLELDGTTPEARRRDDWQRAADGAVAQIAAAPTPEADRNGCNGKNGCGVHREIAEVNGQVAPSTEANGRTLRATRASEITMRAVRWLWEDESVSNGPTPGNGFDHWLPLGEMALLAGREGIGKSTWAYRIAAQLTTGELSGAFHGQPQSVVVVATEDAWAQVIVPRLTAAEADLSRVIRVDAVEQGHDTSLMLPADIHALGDLCDEHNVRLILLDPLMGTIGSNLDSHKDRDIRQALEPLSRLAHDRQATVLGLIHENKSAGKDLLTRIMGSRAFTAVVRSVLYAVAEEPELGAKPDHPSFWFGQAKNNLAAQIPHVLRYHIEGIRVGRDPELSVPIWSSRIVVDGTVDERVQDLVTAQENRAAPKETRGDRCAKWLQDLLTAQGPTPSASVRAAAEEAGYPVRTVTRARTDLGIQIVSIPGTNHETEWRLPDPPKEMA